MNAFPIIKPLLARDIDESKLKFPLIAQPKIDGSMAFVQNGKLYARSLKPHENKYTTEFYSKPEFEGLRGELILGDDPAAKDLCRNTSSALRTIEGEPYTTLWCFDYITEHTKNLSYENRLNELAVKVFHLNNLHIKIVPHRLVGSKECYYTMRSEWLLEGFEGVILRDPNLPHKEGRSSAIKAHLWRFKPYSSAEIVVTRIEEGQTNLNEAQIDKLGHTKRSTHQENMVPNGQVGTILGTLVNDLLDFSGDIIAKAGTEVRVSPGEMSLKDREYYFINQHEIIGQIVEFDYMSFGLKDKPRFATYKRIRSLVDMS